MEAPQVPAPNTHRVPAPATMSGVTFGSDAAGLRKPTKQPSSKMLPGNHLGSTEYLCTEPGRLGRGQSWGGPGRAGPREARSTPVPAREEDGLEDGPPPPGPRRALPSLRFPKPQGERPTVGRTGVLPSPPFQPQPSEDSTRWASTQTPGWNQLNPAQLRSRGTV